MAAFLRNFTRMGDFLSSIITPFNALSGAKARVAFAAGAVGLLAGCAAAVNENGELLSESPSYQAGYGDGCATSNEENKSFSTKKVRDAYLFDNDKAYRTGWRQGYLACGERLSENISDGGLIRGDESPY